MSPQIGQPMAGCQVLITAERRSAELGAALSRRGAVIRHAPALSMIPDQDDESLVAGTLDLIRNPPDVMVVTTGIGFRGWVEAADAAGLAEGLLEALSGARLVARGPKARGALQAAGLLADWVAESETSAEVAELLLGEGVAGLRVGIQHHGAGADGLDEAFREAGADVASVVVYRWGPPPDPQAVVASVRACAAGDLDAVVFTSAPGAAAWMRIAVEEGLVEDLRHWIADGRLLPAAVGPVTARPLREAGIEPLIPDRGRLGSLVRALVAHYAEREDGALATVAGRLQVRAVTAVLDERVLPISRGGLEVLRLLVRAGGDVVPRHQVLTVLPGSSQDPHAVEAAVSRLREACGHRGMIRTVVKRGYRLEVAR